MSASLAHDMCRTLGHSWYEADSSWVPRWGTPFEWRCDRCGTTRREVIDVHGQVSHRKYLYPEGYRSAEKLTRAQYRVMMIRQMRKARKADS